MEGKRNQRRMDLRIEASPMPRLLRILTIITGLGFAATLYLGLVAAGTDIQQGEIQRIFYIHMPSFFGAFTAFGLTVARRHHLRWRGRARNGTASRWPASKWAWLFR